MEKQKPVGKAQGQFILDSEEHNRAIGCGTISPGGATYQ
jgi:hypothetical protein